MADEVIEVEATPIDQELSILSKAEKWLAGAAERVATQSEQYKPPKRIESEQMRKDCTNARTSVRKDVATIDAERKAMLRDAEDALKRFKANVKDVLTPLTDLDAEYKRLLDEYEEQWRTDRVIELTEEYEAIAPDIALPGEGCKAAIVPFERLMARFGNEKGKVWTNRTTNIVAAKEMLGAAIYTIADAEKTIRDQLTGFSKEEVKSALGYYFDTLDLQKALSNVRHMREQHEQLERLEAERAAREAAWEEPQPEVEPSPAPVPAPMPDLQPVVQPSTDVPNPVVIDMPHSWVIIASLATKAQMLQLRDYARSVGIPFDCIYSGTLEEVYGRLHNAG